MRINIDLSQASTQRGIIWLLFGVVGIVFAWLEKDTTQLLGVFAAIAAGFHGVVVDDKSAKK
jgi:drug/metabolite transporter (DMT)-like permease